MQMDCCVDKVSILQLYNLGREIKYIAIHPKSFREEVNTRVKVNTNLHDNSIYKKQQSDDNKSGSMVISGPRYRGPKRVVWFLGKGVTPCALAFEDAIARGAEAVKSDLAPGW